MRAVTKLGLSLVLCVAGTGMALAQTVEPEVVAEGDEFVVLGARGLGAHARRFVGWDRGDRGAAEALELIPVLDEVLEQRPGGVTLGVVDHRAEDLSEELEIVKLVEVGDGVLGRALKL